MSSTLGFLVENIVLILVTSTIFVAIIYYFDDKKNKHEDINKEAIKKRNWTYLGRIEFLSFFPKPIIILGVIAFWSTILLIVIR